MSAPTETRINTASRPFDIRISNGLEAVLILVSVGALIGTWIAGGVVPTLIYYGLEFINPHVFLLATLINSKP